MILTDLEGTFKYKFADAIHNADSVLRELSFWNWSNNSYTYVSEVLNEPGPADPGRLH